MPTAPATNSASKPAPKCNHTPAASLFDDWKRGIQEGRTPVLYPVGVGDFAAVKIGPQRITVLGGMPGVGKTALATQWVFDALGATPTLKAAFLNVEMTADELFTRQLARYARVNLSAILGGTRTDAERKRTDNAFDKMRQIFDRLTIIDAPNTLASAARSAADFGASMIVLDYVQRIAAEGRHSDKRAETNAAMGCIRGMAKAGAAVLVLSAINRDSYRGAGRGKGRAGKGRADDSKPTLGCFRESSELEFGANDAYVLDEPPAPAATEAPPVPSPDPFSVEVGATTMNLWHLKCRDGPLRDIRPMFNKPFQTFIPPGLRGKI